MALEVVQTHARLLSVEVAGLVRSAQVLVSASDGLALGSGGSLGEVASAWLVGALALALALHLEVSLALVVHEPALIHLAEGAGLSGLVHLLVLGRDSLAGLLGGRGLTR